RSSSWLVTMNGIAEAAYLLDDADTAARVYEQLRPYAALPMLVSLGVACFGSVQHALGVAALTAGRLDQAVKHLRAAVEDNLALRHWPALINSRLQYARALTRRGQPADAQLARRELATAHDEAAALGIAVPDHLSQPPTEPLAATCTRAGQHWRIDYGRRTVLVPHSVGMLHLAVLLANPGREIPALDLAAGVATRQRV